MDASTLSRIFEPFFTTKELGKGTGLGLATVYGIVKQSDGYIYCDSFPGKGTSFLIYFPRVPGTGGDDRAERAQTTNGTGDETVLLVEDEDALRGFVRTILQRHGYTVIDAQDGVAALELLSRGDRVFDILVTDVVMPRMGGHELAQRVLEAHPAMRVLYMSGYTEEHIVRPAVTDRRIDLIRKPFDTAGFLAHLREVLDRP